MTKRELFDRRYRLLKQTTSNYMIQSMNAAFADSDENFPDVKESIFFVPDTDKELINYLTDLQNYKTTKQKYMPPQIEPTPQANEQKEELTRPSIRHKSNQVSLFDSGEADDDDFAMLDTIDGYAFQDYIADLFQRLGYNANVNNMAYDWGVDIIVKCDLFSIGIQCKLSNVEKIDNSAVQEIVAGIKHYKLDKGMVITNSYFHKSTIQLAQENNVLLWDRNVLYKKIKELSKFRGDNLK